MGIRSQNNTNPLAAYLDVFSSTGTDAVTPAVSPSGLTATGGVISDYTSGSDVYRAHVFTSSGALNVTALATDSSLPNTVDYLVVAGGGAGGGTVSAGGGRGAGGAGGLRTNVPGVQNAAGSPLTGAAFPVSVQSYTVTVGGGGSKTFQANGNKGTNSSFGPITSEGGGAGGYSVGSNQNDGGSGGSDYQSGTPNVGLGNTPPTSPPQGNNSGQGGDQCSGGGGGAGAVGTNGTSTAAGAGGAGVQVAIAGPTATTFTGVGAKNPSNNQYQYFAGGGGGAGSWNANPGVGAAGGLGGGGAGKGKGGYADGENGQSATGGGGGGTTGNGSGSGYSGGAGGSGIVVVRYQIGSVTGTAKATGGAISYYGGKTIHAFTGSGTFVTESNWDAGTNEVQYVVVAGGGAGGNNLSGGGGAGGFLAGTTTINHPSPVSIQVGAGGAVRTTPIAYGDRASLYGNSGTPSYFGTPITAYGGGGGGAVDSNNAQPGGSGGGSGGGSAGGPSGAPGNKQTGTSTAAPGQGNDGGDCPRAGSYGAGGGGGAGGAGTSNSDGGVGGVGAPVPATFQNPVSILNAHDPSPYKFTIAAGGGGGKNGSGDGGVGGYGGGGDAGDASSTPTSPGDNAIQGTGSGGGGAGHSPAGGYGGGGGSGIVLIAYPS